MDGLLPSTNTTNGQTKVINSFYPNAVPGSHAVTSPTRDYHHTSAAAAVDSYFLDHQSAAAIGGDNLGGGTYGQPSSTAASIAAMSSAESHHHYPSPYLTTEASFYDQPTHHGIATRLQHLSLDSATNNHQATTITSQQPQPPQATQKPTYTDSSKSVVVPTQPQSMVVNRTPADTACMMPSATNDNSNLSFFVADSMREELVRRLAKSQEMVSENVALDLPAKVDVFIELIQIEALSGGSSFTFNGMPSTVYRATNGETGQMFCLRRFHGFQPNTANAKLLMATIESWKRIQHANIVSLRQVFTTKAFGDNSVIFVYDYHPLSETIMSCYFSNQLNSLTAAAAAGAHPAAAAAATSMMNGYSTSSRPYSQQQNTRNKFLPEQTIWNYIIQISSALRTIHQSGLAFRSLDPSKILITSGWSSSGGTNGAAGSSQSANNLRGRDARVKLSFCGVFDILTLDTFHHSNTSNQHRAFIQHLQQEDLVLFGRLCLALSTNSLAAFTQRDLNLQEYMDLLPRTYSNDLRNLISYLISYKGANASKPRSIDDIMPMIGARFYMQLDYFYLRYDYLYEELTKEVDNGRLLRLLSKLGTINERPEHQLDPNWSETGDRYMLKLFRDYLFHQFDENGKPWLDLGHIISNLNKFDVGSPEKICLISRDAQNVIIVSFDELKRCFEAAINDLMQC